MNTDVMSTPLITLKGKIAVVTNFLDSGADIASHPIKKVYAGKKTK